jgi:hypothetical protein
MGRKRVPPKLRIIKGKYYCTDSHESCQSIIAIVLCPIFNWQSITIDSYGLDSYIRSRIL